MADLNIFIKHDIEMMIKTGCQSVGYIRGYTNACYHLSRITRETFIGLKNKLAENTDNQIKEQKEGERKEC